ncbi:MAG: NTP transferase domain-containing protein [Candidatus Aminicenantes bacterium]|nr:NTP transferase domain-containing protein [Candidatus Aminicenantes bacterium]
MADKIKAVVLAAGKSTRMKSGKTKVLHKILGKEIIHYLLDGLVACGIADPDIVVVVGDDYAEIAAAVKRKVVYARQWEQLGTAHALLAAREHIAGHDGELLVAVGDNPYITVDALQKLIAAHRRERAQCTFISAVFPGTPPPYGRVVRDGQGEVQGIVEEKDADPEQRLIREVNAAIYLFDNRIVFPLLAQIGNRNAKKEYYLTDIIAILRSENFKVTAVQADDCDIAIGINDRRDLQTAHEKFNLGNQRRLVLECGVTILQPATVTVEHGVEIGMDTVIYPCTYLAVGTRIGRNCHIGPYAYLKNVRVADNEKVIFEKREA